MQMRGRAVCLWAVVIALALATPQASAQQPADSEKLAEMCKKVLCRQPTTIKLTLDNGKPFETTFKYPVPIVIRDNVTVLPGEKIFLEADRQGDRLVNLRAVESNRNPDKTIVIEFEHS